MFRRLDEIRRWKRSYSIGNIQSWTLGVVFSFLKNIVKLVLCKIDRKYGRKLFFFSFFLSREKKKTFGEEFTRIWNISARFFFFFGGREGSDGFVFPREDAPFNGSVTYSRINLLQSAVRTCAREWELCEEKALTFWVSFECRKRERESSFFISWKRVCHSKVERYIRINGSCSVKNFL